MSDRLASLRHQRALVEQQLDWLDQEIAALEAPGPAATPARAIPSSASLPTPAPTPAPQPLQSPLYAKPLLRTPKPAPPAIDVLEDFPEYQADPANMQSEARRGCLIYTVIAFVVLILAMTAIYFFAYRDHPLLLVPERAAPTSSPAK
ncbi:MAG: hypothetical protein JWM32_966 [Verrucomicrobia bacterium]|nr:hypothetical protein [Verrucomicrobiota bacterium]